jgi:glycosyltransferase 2 family protein
VRAEVRFAIRLAVAAIVVYFVYRTLATSWDDIRLNLVALRPSWPGLILASLATFTGYAVLIAAWRQLLSAWQSPLDILNATRIWFVSSLGKYVPGKIWSIGAMAVLAKEAGASPVAATGSAVIMQLVNLAAGFAVLAFAGAGELLALYPMARLTAWATLVATVIGLAFGPQLLTAGVRTAERVVGRPISKIPALSHRALLTVFAANVIAWVAYGIAFGLFWSAVLGRGGGVSLAALAVFTASYLIGFLVLPAPGGLGVREAALVALLLSLKLATPADAALLAATSRIWLTVLEIVPGLILLPGVSLRRRSSISTPDGPAA